MELLRVIKLISHMLPQNAIGEPLQKSLKKLSPYYRSRTQWSTTSSRPLPLQIHINQLVDTVFKTIGIKGLEVMQPPLVVKQKLRGIFPNGTNKPGRSQGINL